MSVIKFPSRKLNKKKMYTFISLSIILLTILILIIIYFFNSSFRRFLDINIFRKTIKANNLASININSDEDQFFYAYDKYIAVLDKNILYTYNSSVQVEAKNDVIISNPIFANNNKFLAIGENGGNNIYLVCGTNILWQKSLDGNISQININKNGYISVILSGTSYKSIIVSFDSKGNELFKTYLSNNIAISCDISNDNKYLSIAEIDYSGLIIKSTVKTISIEKTKLDPTNSVIYAFNFKDNDLVTNIKYQDKNNLICISQNNIYSLNINDRTDNQLFSLNNSNYEFIDINLKNNFLYTFNESHGFTNTAIINIYNIQNNSINKYEFKGSIKSILTNNEKIAINTGSEIHFIGLNGWLIKKYDSYNEVNKIILGDSIAGIVYKDKIEIINI